LLILSGIIVQEIIVGFLFQIKISITFPGIIDNIPWNLLMAKVNYTLVF
jgi:hypothetical protein